MVARGLVTLEQLDQPTPSWRELEQDRSRSLAADQIQGWPGRRVPAFRYPLAGTAQAPRNLAREWIGANQKAWTAMLEGLMAEQPDGLAAPGGEPAVPRHLEPLD